MVGVAGSLATEVLILRIEKGCLILIGLANESVARTYVLRTYVRIYTKTTKESLLFMKLLSCA